MAIYQSKKIDLIVVHAGSSNQLSSSLDVRLADRLKQIDGRGRRRADRWSTPSRSRRRTWRACWSTAGSRRACCSGGIRILDGRPLRQATITRSLLGRVLALNLDKKVGDTLDVSGEPFQVVGIFESDSLFENGALIVPLKTLQKMMGREGQATGLVITAKSSDRASVEALRTPDRGGDPGRRGDARATTSSATPRSAWPRRWPGRPRWSP